MSAARRLARVHLTLAAVWVTVGLGITLRFPDSVLWVAVMSLWANVASHLSAYDAARAERKQEESP